MIMRSAGRPVAGVSFAGVEYEPDADGFFEVPDEAAAELRHHGLEPAARPEAEPESGESDGSGEAGSDGEQRNEG